jgi:hypothetical protein
MILPSLPFQSPIEVQCYCVEHGDDEQHLRAPAEKVIAHRWPPVRLVLFQHIRKD